MTKKAKQRGRNGFYLTTHSTHFIYGYMASDIWQRTIQIAREETRCQHMGYSFRLAARVLLYAISHRQDITYHGLCYTSRGALDGKKNNSMGPLKSESVRSFPDTNGTKGPRKRNKKVEQESRTRPHSRIATVPPDFCRSCARGRSEWLGDPIRTASEATLGTPTG